MNGVKRKGAGIGRKLGLGVFKIMCGERNGEDDYYVPETWESEVSQDSIRVALAATYKSGVIEPAGATYCIQAPVE